MAKAAHLARSASPVLPAVQQKPLAALQSQTAASASQASAARLRQMQQPVPCAALVSTNQVVWSPARPAQVPHTILLYLLETARPGPVSALRPSKARPASSPASPRRANCRLRPGKHTSATTPQSSRCSMSLPRQAWTYVSSPALVPVAAWPSLKAETVPARRPFWCQPVLTQQVTNCCTNSRQAR